MNAAADELVNLTVQCWGWRRRVGVGSTRQDAESVEGDGPGAMRFIPLKNFVRRTILECTWGVDLVPGSLQNITST